MRRRQFLGTLATLGVVGPGAVADRAPDRLDVSVWLSERASSYDAVARRIEGYLTAALTDLYDEVALTVAKPVSVSTEDAYELMVSGEWPSRLAGRSLTSDDRPRELNLLVTDGDVTQGPTGLGVPYLAAVGGARHLAAMQPADETPETVRFSLPALAVQLLLHEAGHALGFDHDYGGINVDGDVATVSPMVSTYPWESDAVRQRQFDADHDACGGAYPPDVGTKRPRLSLRYARCARRTVGADHQ